MHPPHQPQPNDFGRKITLNFAWDLFFFFGDHLILGEKNVWISDFGRKITLNFGEDIRSFEVLCLKSPPPKFSRSATGHDSPRLLASINNSYDITIGHNWDSDLRHHNTLVTTNKKLVPKVGSAGPFTVRETLSEGLQKKFGIGLNWLMA